MKINKYVMLSLMASGVSSAQETPSIKVENAPICSSRILTECISDGSLVSQTVELSKQNPPSPDALKNQAEYLKKGIEAFKSEKRRGEYGKAAVRFSKSNIDSIIDIGSKVGGPVGTFIMGKVKYLNDEMHNLMMNEIEESAAYGSRAALSKALKSYEKDNGLDSLKDKAPEVILSLLQEKGHYNLDKIGFDTDAEARALINGAAIKQLQAGQAAGLKKILQFQVDNAQLKEDVGILKGSITKLEKHQNENIKRINKIYEIAKNHNKRISTLEKQMASIGNNVLQNTQQIDILSDLTYANASPKQKIQALKRGLFPNLDKKKRASLILQIEAEKERLEFLTDAQEFIAGAGHVVNIASNLGVDPDIVNTVNTVVNAGSNIVQGIAQWSTNPLAAISSFSNVLGLGGNRKSAAQQRHEQLVSILKGVLENQKQIRAQLKRMEGKIDKIAELQVQTLQELYKLQERIDKRFDELNTKVDWGNSRIIYNTELIRKLYEKDLSGIVSILDNIKQNSSSYKGILRDVSSLDFVGYTQRKAHYAKFSNQFASGLKGLQSNLILDPLWKLESYVEQQDPYYKNFLNSWHSLSRWSKQEFVKYKLDDSLVMLSLKTMNSNYQGWESKWSDTLHNANLPNMTRMDYLPDRYKSDVGKDSFWFIDENSYYSSQASHRLGRYIKLFHAYYDLRSSDTDKRLMTTRELVAQSSIEREKNESITFPSIGRQNLGYALNKIEMTIAQRQLQSGDLIIPALWESWSKSNEEDRKKIKLIINDIVKSNGERTGNQYFAKNLVGYFLWKEFSSGLTESQAIRETRAYHLALFDTSSKIFKDLLSKKRPLPFEIKRVKKESDLTISADIFYGYSAKLDDVQVGLPNVNEVVYGKVSHHPSLIHLRRLRDELLLDYIDYGFLENKILKNNSEARESLFTGVFYYEN